MSKPHSKTPHTRNRQRGTALIVALILLLVVTLLGVTAMNSSLMQGFMSASYQEQTRTLATAENLLLQGEFEVVEIVTSGVASRPGRPGYYLDLTTGANPPQPSFAAASIASWNGPGVFIEYLGRRIIPGESVAVGGGLEDSLIHVFRVSAFRPPDPANARGGLRIVQSLYVTLDPPFDGVP